MNGYDKCIDIRSTKDLSIISKINANAIFYTVKQINNCYLFGCNGVLIITDKEF